jgi:hypothetical protein
MLIFCLFAVTTAIWSGCAIRPSDPLEDRAQVSYYDRNGDGKVDLERHQHPVNGSVPSIVNHLSLSCQYGMPDGSGVPGF